MHFDADVVSSEKFTAWIDAARGTGLALDQNAYTDLTKPSTAVGPYTYRAVEPGLFDKIRVSDMRSDDPICRENTTSMRAEK